MGYAINRIPLPSAVRVFDSSCFKWPRLSASAKLTLRVLLLIPLLLEKFSNSKLIDNKFTNSIHNFHVELEL